MYAHIQKWGNSLGLRIPSQLSKQMSLGPGSEVDIFIEEDRLIIKPKKESLKTLLSQITPANCHYESFEEDDQIGNEVW